MPAPVIVLFRNDLRLADHAALSEAAKAAPVIPLFVLDESSEAQRPRGSASKWWLHHSLKSLQADIEDRGGHLILRQGDTVEIVAELVSEADAEAVHIMRHYEPWAVHLEKALKETLEGRDVNVRRFAGHLLMEPEDIETQAGDPYKVYTPFWRSLKETVAIRSRTKAPKELKGPGADIDSDDLDDWGLLPSKPNWADGWDEIWTPGEAGGHERLEAFVDEAVGDYDDARDRPDQPGTSRLSPHLHFGEISPHTVWQAVAGRGKDPDDLSQGRETYLKELVWRDFSAHLLFHFPHIVSEPFKEDFKDFPWRENAEDLRAWQRGQTGYPIVDAGMRQLWQTGWMHNRVRMIVASFLTKHLLIPWQEGEAWFWDTLVDADLANNTAGWQWVAGSGADASPYFRIFNPMTQGEKFDPDGDYIRKWVPELKDLPDSALNAPFEADEKVLSEAGVTLGETYPEPLVRHKPARERALEAYDKIKN